MTLEVIGNWIGYAMIAYLSIMSVVFVGYMIKITISEIRHPGSNEVFDPIICNDSEKKDEHCDLEITRRLITLRNTNTGDVMLKRARGKIVNNIWKPLGSTIADGFEFVDECV